MTKSGYGQYENEVAGYFLSLDVQPDIYESLIQLEEGLTPQQLMHQMLLKRLNMRVLRFEPILIDGYGCLELPTVYFALHDIIGSDAKEVYEQEVMQHGESDAMPDNLYRTVFKMDDGTATIDWYHMTFMFQFNDGVLSEEQRKQMDLIDVDSGVYITPIAMFRPLRVERVGDDLEITLSICPRDGDINDQSTIQNTSVYVDHYRIKRGAVVFDATSDILPEYPVKLKEVSNITDISASTLSELRHGKKEVGNLAVSTASLLTQYGDIRFLDRFLLDAKSDASMADKKHFIYHTNKGVSEKNVDDTNLFSLHIELKNDTTYTKDFETRDDMLDFIDYFQKDTGKPYVMLESGYEYSMIGKYPFDTIVVSKEEVVNLYTTTINKEAPLNNVYQLVVTMRDGTKHKMKYTDLESMNHQYDLFVDCMNDKGDSNCVVRGGLDSLSTVDGTILYAIRGSDIMSVTVKQFRW